MKKINILFFFSLIIISANAQALIIDGFEDANIETNRLWQPTTSNLSIITNTQAHSGTYSFQMKDGNIQSYQSYLLPGDDLNEMIIWWRMDNNQSNIFAGMIDADNNNYVGALGYRISSGKVMYSDGAGFKFMDTNITPSLNTWYGSRIVWDTNQLDFYLVDTNGTTLSQKINVTRAGSGTDYSAIRIEKEQTTGNAYWDDWADDINGLVLVSITTIGNRDYASKSYVRDLNYIINYTCIGNVDFNVTRSINDTNDLIYTPSCNSQSGNSSTVTYTHSTEGQYNLRFWLKEKVTNNIALLFDNNFISDLNPPTADINFSTSQSGFFSGNPQVNVSLSCIDTISARIDYNIFNAYDINIFSGQRDANTIVNVTTDTNTGTTEFEGWCTDLGNNRSLDINSVSVFASCFQLVDELTGLPLSTSDINSQFTSLTATSYATGDINNFKSPLHNNTCFASVGNDTIRFDLNYTSGTQLYKEFNLIILEDLNTTIPVCVADDQDFFEQLFTSSQQRETIVKNQLSECYSMADYTKYALQDSLSNRAFTIQMPYTLYTNVDGNTIILSLINGAVESTINLDVLVFKIQTFETGLQPDELTIARYLVPPATDSNTVVIYYDNLAGNNTIAQLKIYDGNALISNQTITSTPNRFTAYFDTTTIDINSDVLKIQVVKTLSDGSSETLTRYFTMSGTSAIFPSGLGILFAFIVTLFGLTLIRWSYVLGWFGLIVCVAGVAILGFTAPTGPVIFLQAVLLIAAAFIFIIYKDDTVRTT